MRLLGFLRCDESGVTLTVFERFVCCFKREIPVRCRLFDGRAFGLHMAQELTDREPPALEYELFPPCVRARDEI